MKAIFIAVALAIVMALGNTQDLPEPGVCGVSSIAPKPPSRIVNGETAIPHSRPYQLLLVGFFPNGTAKYYCGASLIKPTHALTAAHCVAGNEAKDIRLYPGIHEFTSALLTPSAGIPAREYFRHESFNNQSLANDIAIIRLQTPVVIDNVKTGLICLPPASAPACTVGTPVVASGWGAFTSSKNITGPSRPTELNQVGLQCVDAQNSDCRRLTYTLFFIQDKSKMCAYAPNKGVCFGDSGGPLVRERTTASGQKYLEQVGIMSGTVDCSFSKPSPDIYADVRYFNAWILNKIKASS
ncbi:unnamed protein product [Adineta ricciae]|uniref:Peptidase S1 domain-containing protein n=1 Tax=Adineta ricciae TaxID=249248 RepID=A0A816DBM6_ADIRI|nr:unnamed protein product [Adineta ricciae]